MNPSGVRIDIWLWRARFFKTRQLAIRAIKKGHMRLFRHAHIQKLTKPHTHVGLGDKLSFICADTPIFIEILSLGTRRGPATEAQSLYRFISDPKNRQADTATSGPLTASTG